MDVRSSTAGVTGSYEMSNMGVGTQTWGPLKEQYELNC